MKMTIEKSNNASDKMKARIDDMIEERPSHKEVLEFLKEVMTEQYRVRQKVKIVPVKIDDEKIKRMKEGHSLLGKKDLDIASAPGLFKRLCKILTRTGNASRDAKRINKALRSKEIILAELFEQFACENGQYLSGLSRRLEVEEALLSFLVKSSIKPMLESYACQLKDYVDREMWWRSYCPICGSPPLLAELRGEGERLLVCSSCSFEWRFARLKCPFCENEDHQGLRYFYAEKEGKAVRVDVCEKCRKYIKTVDTRELGEEIIPLVEDIGTLYLDVLAQREGYTREGMICGGLVSE